jgi:hypothetical protein
LGQTIKPGRNEGAEGSSQHERPFPFFVLFIPGDLCQSLLL